MKPYERVDAAFSHQPPDRVPIYQAGFSSKVGSYVLGREAFVGGGMQRYREAVSLWQGDEAHREYLERSFTDAAEICEKLDLDLVRTIYWRMPRKPASRIDDNTFEYPGGEVWRFDPPTETYGLVDQGDREELSPEDLRRAAREANEREEEYDPTPADFPDHLRALERFRGERCVHGGSVGISIPREREWLEAMVLDPDTVGLYLDAAAKGATKAARVMSEMGLRYCFGGGDFAGNDGPFYSPRLFHDLMLPRLKRISEACHKHGVLHLFASDGDLWPVAEDLFGASGVDGFYEVDRNFMDARQLRARFPRLVLVGGIRSEMLHLGTVAQVIDETRTAIEAAKEIGGSIVGCSNQIVAPTPEENFWAMMETLEKYR